MNSPSCGICLSCNQEFTKNVMTKHLAGCAARKPGSESRLHIVAQGMY